LSNRILLLLAFCGLVASASAQSSFTRLNFTVGGGPGIGRHDVASYVGDSAQATLGAGMNFSRMFGVDAEYMYYNLGFRQSVIIGQSLPGQHGHMQSISLNGIVNVPRRLGPLHAYGILGLGFYDRSVSISPSRPLQAGTVYQPAWRWWDVKRDIFNNPIPGQIMGSNSKTAGGFNFGGGFTYPLRHLDRAKVFMEFRYHRAYQSDGETIVVPITIGLRW